MRWQQPPSSSWCGSLLIRIRVVETIIVEEDGLAAIAPLGDVVRQARESYAGETGHQREEFSIVSPEFETPRWHGEAILFSTAPVFLNHGIAKQMLKAEARNPWVPRPRIGSSFCEAVRKTLEHLDR